MKAMRENALNHRRSETDEERLLIIPSDRQKETADGASFFVLMFMLTFLALPLWAATGDDDPPLPETVEQTLLKKLEAHPRSACQTETGLTARLQLLQQLAGHYGYMARLSMLQRVVREGQELLATSSLSPEEQAKWQSQLIDGYYHYAFVAHDSITMRSAVESDEQFLTKLPAKVAGHRLFEWRQRLNQAWKAYCDKNYLRAKLLLCNLINDLYLFNLSEKESPQNKPYIPAASRMELYARFLMSDVCKANGEVGLCILYLHRISSLMGSDGTLMWTAIDEHLAEHYMAIYHSDYSYWLNRLEDNVKEMKFYMLPDIYKHYQQMVNRKSDKKFTDRVERNVWTQDDDRQLKRWEELQEQLEALDKSVKQKRVKETIQEAREAWRLFIDFMANNFVSYEYMHHYFHFLNTYSSYLIQQGLEEEGGLREMFTESVHLISNIILQHYQLAECYGWTDYKNRCAPFYYYSEGVNTPHKQKALDKLSGWLTLLSTKSQILAETASELKNSLAKIIPPGN